MNEIAKGILARFASLGVVSITFGYIIVDISRKHSEFYISSHDVRVIYTHLNEDDRVDSVVIDSRGYKTPFIGMEDGNFRSASMEEIPAIYSGLEQIK